MTNNQIDNNVTLLHDRRVYLLTEENWMHMGVMSITNNMPINKYDLLVFAQLALKISALSTESNKASPANKIYIQCNEKLTASVPISKSVERNYINALITDLYNLISTDTEKQRSEMLDQINSNKIIEIRTSSSTNYPHTDEQAERAESIIEKIQQSPNTFLQAPHLHITTC